MMQGEPWRHILWDSRLCHPWSEQMHEHDQGMPVCLDGVHWELTMTGKSELACAVIDRKYIRGNYLQPNSKVTGDIHDHSFDSKQATR